MKERFIIFFIIFYTIQLGLIKAQKINTSEKYLINKLNAVQNDSLKAIILTELFYRAYNSADVKKALNYTKSLYQLGKSSNNSFILYKAHSTQSFHYSNLLKTDSAIYFDKQAILYAEKSEKAQLVANANYSCALNYRHLNNIDKALYHLNISIESYLKSQDDLGLANAYNLLGGIYYDQGKLNLSIEYCIKSDSLISKGNYNDPVAAAILYNIGGVFLQLKEYDKAEQYFTRSAIHSKNNLNKNNEMIALLGLAEVHIVKREFREAEEQLNKTFKYFKSTNDKLRESESCYLLGEVYAELNENQKALSYLIRSLNINENVNHNLGIIKTNFTIGEVYYKNNDYRKSKTYYLKAKKLAEEIGLIEYNTRSTLQLAKSYSKLNDYKSAIEHYQEYIPLNDSLLKRQNREYLFNLETKYQTEKKEQEIKILSIENTLKEEQNKNQKILFLCIIGIVLLAILYIFLIYKNKLKLSKKLKELDDLKSRFFANITHEIRSPLTLIKSPVQILDSSIIDPELKKQVELIDLNTDRLISLVDQLFELSRIESGNLTLIFRKQKLSSILETIVESYIFEAEKKGIRVSKQIKTSELTYWFDRDAIEKIISNLLSNALKYTSENGFINIYFETSAEELKLTFSNSIDDLETPDIERFFQRYYQKNKLSDGAGIGLSLVSEIVNLYKGKINTEIKDQMITFQIVLPLNKEIVDQIGILVEDLPSEKLSDFKIEKNLDLPRILLIDDNLYIREVLKNIFKNDFQIFEATNGFEGLSVSKEQVPDIIISDIMMPEMSGLEFATKIKEDEITSFIPIILLTAKTGDQTHLQAISRKVDAFITKPFNHEVLRSKVAQLLEERENLKRHFSKEILLKPKDIFINSTEEKFITRLQKVLDDHLFNSEFSAEDFAGELNMSRMQLHRKLKSLTGLSASEFIRKERLNASKNLFKKEKRISEVAYKIGFNNVDYFSKLFKSEFGITPSEFIKSMEECE